MASQRMIPSMVVDMFLQNGIHNVKVFSPSRNVLEAFCGTNINLTIAIPNTDLKNYTNIEDVREFLREYVVPAIEDDVKIRYLNVGSQPFSTSYSNKTYFFVNEVMHLFQIALKEDEFARYNVKATMSHYTDVLLDTNIPSKGEFKPEVKSFIARACKLLEKENTPVWLDLFLIDSVKRLFNNDIEFAFIDNNSSSVFMDGDKKYNNIFEVMYDTFLYALRKVEISNLTVIVGQVGWPTDGIDGASIVNAHRFFKSFIKYIVDGKGTPLYPHPMDVYIYNIADESKLKLSRGNFTRHWGIYKFDGHPKYNIDFSGQGREITLNTLKGVTHMPRRWCIFNGKTEDMAKIKAQFDIACNVSDCTSLAPGGSCGQLRFPHNISYAFNMYFQTKGQKVFEESCNFEGLGVVVPDDPSRNQCLFPVEILSSEKPKEAGTSSNNSTSHIVKYKVIYLILLVLISFVLI